MKKTFLADLCRVPNTPQTLTDPVAKLFSTQMKRTIKNISYLFLHQDNGPLNGSNTNQGHHLFLVSLAFTNFDYDVLPQKKEFISHKSKYFYFLLNPIIYSYFNHFTTCLVPDQGFLLSASSLFLGFLTFEPPLLGPLRKGDICRA